MAENVTTKSVPNAKEDFDRCASCGVTLIADGTEEADFAVLCEQCLLDDEEEYGDEIGVDDVG